MLRVYEENNLDLTFTNILAPPSPLAGVQYTDMDFLSRENSRVKFFFISCLTTCLKREAG